MPSNLPVGDTRGGGLSPPNACEADLVQSVFFFFVLVAAVVDGGFGCSTS